MTKDMHMHDGFLSKVFRSLGGVLLAAALAGCGGSDGPPADQIRGALELGLASGFDLTDVTLNGFTEDGDGVYTSNFSARIRARDDYFQVVGSFGGHPIVEELAEKGETFKLHGQARAEQKGEDWRVGFTPESPKNQFIFGGARSHMSRAALAASVVKGSEAHEELLQASDRQGRRQVERERRVAEAEREALVRLDEQVRQKERELMEQLEDQMFEAVVSNERGLRGSLTGAARTELVLSIEERDASRRTFVGEAIDLSGATPRVFRYEASVRGGPILVFEGDFGEDLERVVMDLWNEGGALAQSKHVARLLPISESEAAELFAAVDMIQRGHAAAQNMRIQAQTLPAIRRMGVDPQYRVRSPIVDVTATGDVRRPQRWTDGYIDGSRTTARLPEGGGRVEFRLARPEMAHGIAMYFSSVPDERPEFAADADPRHFPVRINGGAPLSWPMPNQEDRGVLLMFEEPMPVGSFTFEQTNDDVSLSEVQFIQRPPDPSG